MQGRSPMSARPAHSGKRLDRIWRGEYTLEYNDSGKNLVGMSAL